MRLLFVFVITFSLQAFAIDEDVPIWEQYKAIKCEMNFYLICRATDRQLDMRGHAPDGCTKGNFGFTYIADFEKNYWQSLSHGPDHIPWPITSYNFDGKLVHQISVGQKIIDLWVTTQTSLGTFRATKRFSNVYRSADRTQVRGIESSIDEYTCIPMDKR